MGQGVSLATLISFIDYFFPSLSQYTKFVAPAIMFLFTAIGIFTNILPEPGHVYPVPNVTDLETELDGSGKFILKIAKLARNITIAVNWFIATTPYIWFYNATNTLTNIIYRFHFSASPPKNTGITPPQPYVVKIDPKGPDDKKPD